MGDRTYGAVTLLQVPPTEVNAVRAVLAEYDLLDGDPRLYDASRKSDEGVWLWEPYADSEMSVGTVLEIAAALIKEAPGTSFVAEDTVYNDWLADLVIYTPDLGRFDGNSAGDGRVMFTADEVLALIDATLTRQQVEETLGKPWTDWVRTRGEELGKIARAEAAREEAAKVESQLHIKST